MRTKWAELPVELYGEIGTYLPDYSLLIMLLLDEIFKASSEENHYWEIVAKSRKVNVDNPEEFRLFGRKCTQEYNDLQEIRTKESEKLFTAQRLYILDYGHIDIMSLLRMDCKMHGGEEPPPPYGEPLPISKTMDSREPTFTIWGLATQERYQAISMAYIRHAGIFIISLDMVDDEAFLDVERRLKYIQHQCEEIHGVLLVAGDNKAPDEWNIEWSEIEVLAKHLNESNDFTVHSTNLHAEEGDQEKAVKLSGEIKALHLAWFQEYTVKLLAKKKGLQSRLIKGNAQSQEPIEDEGNGEDDDSGSKCSIM